MAMALSRSETEQEAVPAALRLGNAFAERTRLGAGAAAEGVAEKPGRMAAAEASPGVPSGRMTPCCFCFFSREENPQEESPRAPATAVSPGPGDHGPADRGPRGPAPVRGGGAVQHAATPCQQDPRGRAGQGQSGPATSRRGAELAVGGQCPDRGWGPGVLLHGQPGASPGAPAARQGVLPSGGAGGLGERVAALAAAPSEEGRKPRAAVWSHGVLFATTRRFTQ